MFNQCVLCLVCALLHYTIPFSVLSFYYLVITLCGNNRVFSFFPLQLVVYFVYYWPWLYSSFLPCPVKGLNQSMNLIHSPCYITLLCQWHGLCFCEESIPSTLEIICSFRHASLIYLCHCLIRDMQCLQCIVHFTVCFVDTLQMKPIDLFFSQNHLTNLMIHLLEQIDM